MERPFVTFYGIMRAMMLTAEMELDQKAQWWAVDAATATNFGNIVVGPENKAQHECFYNPPVYLRHSLNTQKVDN
jgi:hypothetical protein